jgi:hypothetical protein
MSSTKSTTALRRAALLALVAAGSIGAAAAAGCISSSNTSSPDGGLPTFDSGLCLSPNGAPCATDGGASPGVDATVPTDAAPANGDAAQPTGDATSSGDAETGDAAALSACQVYCNAIMSACTGASAQYPTMGSCLGSCAAYPAGAPTDTSGDTLGCRSHYLPQALTTPATYCAYAGPAGGAVFGDGGPAASVTCGDGCDSFCAIVMTVCTGTNTQFANTAVCLSGCNSNAALRNPPYSTADTTLNDNGCRMFYATSAADPGEDASAFLHDCDKVVPGSYACTQ